MAYYLHYADPGFPEPPWPGERRLGPFETLKEAQDQACSDGAGGYGVAVGIFSATESDKRSDDREAGRAKVGAAEIQAAVDEERKRRALAAASVLQSDREALQALLPRSVTVEELQAEGLLP